MQRIVFSLAIAICFALSAVQAGDSQDFFNGKDLAGFEGLLDQFWSVKDNAIVGTTRPDGIKYNTFLCSKKTYKDFEMRFQVKLTNGNSGIQIRSRIHNKEKFAVTGPQCDIGEGYWGSLYGENFGGMMKQAPAAEINKKLNKTGFNDYYIKCVGKHVTIKVNDVLAVDGDFPKMPNEGIVAFQIHGGPPMDVVFKNIRFKEIK